MMCYLNNQNICASYMDVGRQSKRQVNYVLNEKSGTTHLLKGLCSNSSNNNVDGESKYTSLHFHKP